MVVSPGRLRKRGSDERGAALVEFALVLPLLLVLFFGMVDFGKAFNYWIDGTHLSAEGARWAVVNKNPGSGTLQEYIQQQADTPEFQSGGTGSIADAAPGLHQLPERDGGRRRPGQRERELHLQLDALPGAIRSGSPRPQ